MATPKSKKAPDPFKFFRVEECLNRLAVEPRVVIDEETSGLDWRFNHSVGHVLTFGPRDEDSYYIPVRHAGGGNVMPAFVPQEASNDIDWLAKKYQHPVEVQMAKIIKGRSIQFVGHNLAFDLKFASKHGLALGRDLICTQVNAALINELAPAFSLDACCDRANVKAKLGDELYAWMALTFGGVADRKTQMGNYWRTDALEPKVHEYAMGDGVSTWQLLDWQLAEMEHQELMRVYAVECRVISVLHRMTQRGIKIDEERLGQVLKEIDKRIEGAAKKLPKDFNARASTQVIALMEKEGIDGWPLTEKGNPSFPEEWLLTNEPGRNIVDLRKFTNLRDSFALPLRDRHLYKGRVHTSFNQMRGDEYGTITGRLSSSEPNLQQIHKRNKELGKLFRSIFVPDDGMVMAERDYSQCEPRLLAYYGRVKALMNGYRADPPVDAHQAVAAAAHIDRESGKRLNQSLITGSGEAAVIAKLRMPSKDKPEGHTTEEARNIIRAYFRAMPEIKTLQKRAAAKMRQQGFVRSLLGRRSRLEGHQYAYRGVNRLLQCGNADILKLKMCEMDEYFESEGDTVHLLNNVHDAYLEQFYEQDRTIFERGCEIMVDFSEGQEITLDIPMAADGHEGSNWSIATYGE